MTLGYFSNLHEKMACIDNRAFGLLKLIHFNDLHLLFTPYSFTGVQVSQFYRYTCLYRYMVGILWDVKTLGSYISKTIYPIAMKPTGVT